MRLDLILLFVIIILVLCACGQEPSKSEQQRQPASTYSRETLDKIEKDLNQAMQKSVDRVESALEPDKDK